MKDNNNQITGAILPSNIIDEKDYGISARNRYISFKVDNGDLKARNPSLSMLLEMSNLLAGSFNLEEMMREALSKVIDHFGFDAGRIYLVDADGKYLNLVAHLGMKPNGLERMGIYEGFSGMSVRTKSIIIQHVIELEDKRRAQLLMERGVQVIICVPLINIEKVGGVMNLTSSDPIEIDQEKIDLITTIGNQISIAADNARLYRELNQKISKLNETKEMIKMFAYSVSHDLKSPAFSLYGLTKLLKKNYAGSLDSKGLKTCDLILKTSKQMVYMVEKINEYINTNEYVMKFESVNPRELFLDIIEEFFQTLTERGITWSVSNVKLDIIGDRLSLTRVFRNLIDNAIKYGGERLTELKFGYYGTEALHILSISDDGLGIRSEAKERIFQPFERLENSMGIKGSGLGLAIVHQIATAHNGSAWVETGAEKGTTFFISISKELKAD